MARPKKPDYASMFTLRADGRYQGYWRDAQGKRHALCDRDPEALYNRLQAKAAPAPVTFSAAADAWFADHAAAVTWKTADAYGPCLKRLREQFGPAPLADLTASQITAYLAYLGKRGYARRTVQMHRDILNMIFNHAIVAGHVSVNPCSAAEMPRSLPQTTRSLPDDAAISAVRSSADVPFGLFALVCLYAGLRRGEALALTFADIDRAAGVIHVTKSVTFISNRPEIKPPKTASGFRDVVLLDVLAQALPATGTGYLFSADGGASPLTRTQYIKRWQKYCAAIGYDITAHQLRHGYATILYEAGIQDKDAQELLGHSSITLTRNVYTHIRQSHRSAVADKLNSYFLSANLPSDLPSK